MNKEFDALKQLRENKNQPVDKWLDTIENALNILKIIINRQVDISQIYDSANYDDYTNKIHEFFTDNVETHLGSERDKELWWECYFLTEEEYDLVRSIL